MSATNWVSSTSFPRLCQLVFTLSFHFKRWKCLIQVKENLQKVPSAPNPNGNRHPPSRHFWDRGGRSSCSASEKQGPDAIFLGYQILCRISFHCVVLVFCVLRLQRHRDCYLFYWIFIWATKYNHQFGRKYGILAAEATACLLCSAAPVSSHVASICI